MTSDTPGVTDKAELPICRRVVLTAALLTLRAEGDSLKLEDRKAK
jgi:hypothetical protein